MVRMVIAIVIVVLLLCALAALRRRSNRSWAGSRAGGVERPGDLRRAQEAARIREDTASRRYLADDFAASAQAQEPNGRSLGLGLSPIADGMPGLRVKSVEPRSAAGRVGMQVGDELLKVNGVEVRDPDAVAAMVSKQPPGLAVYIVWRAGGKEKQASVTI